MRTFYPTIYPTIVRVLALALLLGSSSCNGFFTDPQVVSIVVNPATPSLIIGQTQQFSAVATFDDGSRSTLGDADWTTSNSQVMLINSSGMGTAVGAGSATITATSGTGSGSTQVTVNTSPLTSIAVTPANPSSSMSAQPTQQFAAVGTFSDGTTQDITNIVTWSSSDTTVANISATGLATLLKAGTTTIKATSGTVNGTSLLTVTP